MKNNYNLIINTEIFLYKKDILEFRLYEKMKCIFELQHRRKISPVVLVAPVETTSLITAEVMLLGFLAAVLLLVGVRVRVLHSKLGFIHFDPITKF